MACHKEVLITAPPIGHESNVKNIPGNLSD